MIATRCWNNDDHEEDDHEKDVNCYDDDDDDDDDDGNLLLLWIRSFLAFAWLASNKSLHGIIVSIWFSSL